MLHVNDVKMYKCTKYVQIKDSDEQPVCHTIQKTYSFPFFCLTTSFIQAGQFVFLVLRL